MEKARQWDSACARMLRLAVMAEGLEGGSPALVASRRESLLLLLVWGGGALVPLGLGLGSGVDGAMVVVCVGWEAVWVA